MANHEFAIMNKEPKLNLRFDSYVPEEYDYIVSVHDDFIEPILAKLQSLNCYWHTLNRPEKGLAYCGITLIPPSSLNSFLDIVKCCSTKDYYPLICLLEEALNQNKYVIYFGI